MKKKRLLSLLLVSSLVLSCLPFSALAAGEKTQTVEWDDARWIWSSDADDRGPATLWKVDDYQSFLFDDDEAGPGGEAIAHYDDLAAEQDVWMNFRRDFTLDEVPNAAPVKISADAKYWMWINGVEVVFEGQLKRGPNPTDTYYDTLDIAPYLQPGNNTIAIQVWYWGGNKGFSNNPSGSAGLLFESDLTDSGNEGKEVESGDGKWFALRNPANQKDSVSSGMMLTERNVNYNAQKEIDWINPSYLPTKDNGWNTASPIGISEGKEKGMPGDGPWNGLEERPIPFWKDYGRITLEAAPVAGYPAVFYPLTLADMGVSSASYQISADVAIGHGNLMGYVDLADIGILFGNENSYRAVIDTSGYYSGRGTATLKVTRGSEALLGPVDVSSVVTKENAEQSHRIQITVVNGNEVEILIDNQSFGTLQGDFDPAVSSVGFTRSEITYPGMSFDTGSSKVDNILISSEGSAVYSNDFSQDSQMDDFPTAAPSEGCILVSSDAGYGYNVADGQRYQLRLPYNCQMVPYLKLGGATEAGKEIIMTTDTYAKSSYRMVYTTKAGEQEYEGKAWFNGDYLYFDIPAGVEMLELGYRETGYDVKSGENTDFEGYFNSVIDTEDLAYSQFTGGHTWTQNEVSADNNFYDELWKKAARTLYVTIRDQFMDCPDRERSQYIGDAINEMEEGYYSLGTGLNDLDAKAIRNIVDWQIEKEIDGRTYYLMSNVRPGLNKQEISCQSLGTAHAALNHYKFAGDLETVQYAYQKLYNYLTNYNMIEDGEMAGLVEVRPAWAHMYQDNLWQWFDWGDNMDTHLESNVWWYISAKSVREMADLEGVPSTDAQKQWLDERLSSIENNFEKFWNSDLKAYATEWSEETWYSPSALADGSHLVDDRANALAVVFGLVPEEKYPQMRDAFLGTESAPAYENASIYMEKYVIEALYKMGYDTGAMTRMAKRHLSDVNVSTSSTLPEYWNMGGTKNHGWSGGSMIAMSRYAAGVEPTEAGYAAWHIVPQMGNFLSIETRVPSEIGYIDLSLSRDKETEAVEMTVTSPGGNAEFWVPLTQSGTVVQAAGGAAQYQGVKTAYGKSYAVFSSSEPGSFTFLTSDKLEGTADKGILKQVLSYAQSEPVQEEVKQAIVSVQKSFAVALQNAIDVNSFAGATQQQVDDAWKALLTEIHKLGLVAGDKAALLELIQLAECFEAQIGRYTPNTAQPFTTALIQAKAIHSDGDALQGDVAQAESTLLQAMLDLRYRADKSVLEAVLLQAAGIDTTAYTAQSAACFSAAYELAEAVHCNDNSTQSEVNEAVGKLSDAISSLEQTVSPTAVQGDSAETTGRGNVKTGETAPIAAAAVLLALAGAGILLNRKRQ